MPALTKSNKIILQDELLPVAHSYLLPYQEKKKETCIGKIYLNLINIKKKIRFKMEEVEDKRNSLPGFTFDDSEVAAFATAEMDSDESIDDDERRLSS